MSFARIKLSRFQQKKLRSLKKTMQRTQKFSDFLAVINFIHSPDMVSTHVGEVIVHAEEKD